MGPLLNCMSYAGEMVKRYPRTPCPGYPVPSKGSASVRPPSAMRLLSGVGYSRDGAALPPGRERCSFNRHAVNIEPVGLMELG